MKRQSGFTLIELMVVMTVMAIMLGIGIPAFREFTATQRVKTAAYDLMTALLQARSEAIKRNAAVTVTQGAGGWTDGWTVASGGTTLAIASAANLVTITPNPNTTTAVTYQGTGRIASTLRFQISGANTAAIRCVTISTSGVPNSTTTSCP
jgi:type IV fimbrial biogenesis protein FimT